MKSIMEEASTLTKAIENAWLRAGKPTEFKVRIFQESETNFFGFSKKAAKIAFFFEEAKEQHHTRPMHHRPVHKEEPKAPERKQPVHPQPQHHQKQQPQHKSAAQQKPTPAPVKKQDTPQPQQQPKKQFAPVWTDALIEGAKKWIAARTAQMGLPNIAFKTEVNGNNLIIQFDSKLTDSDTKERQLFSGFAHLIIITLRHQFKTSLRRAKVIIKS